MEQLPILIQKSLLTARYWMPVARGWIESNADITLSASISIADVRERRQLVIVDSILASALLGDYQFLTAHCVAGRAISALNLVTAVRPDEVEAVTISTPGVSLSGRTVSEIVIPRFYGITIAGWLDLEHEIDTSHATVTEGVAALVQQPDDQHYHEDLGRAWFLFTDSPHVSYVCIAPRITDESSPGVVNRTIEVLDRLKDASNSRARELRRNLAREHDIDREIITELFADQINQLNDPEIAGLSTLYKQAGLLGDPAQLQQHLR